MTSSPARAFAQFVIERWMGQHEDWDLSAWMRGLSDKGFTPKLGICLELKQNSRDLYYLSLPPVPTGAGLSDFPIWFYPPVAFEPFEPRYWSPIRMPHSVVRCAVNLMPGAKSELTSVDTRALLLEAGADKAALNRGPAPQILRCQDKQRHVIIPAPPKENLARSILRAVAFANDWCWELSQGTVSLEWGA